jgi:hypothetical protein
MATLIERPAFYEGQILAGADLNAGIEHARGQLARHERYLHLWGITEGLELKGQDRKTGLGQPYQEITVSAGMAVDGSGREIVLAAATRLPDEAFNQSTVWASQQPTDVVWYPVFLTGRDSVPPAAPLSVGQCGSSEPNRMREGTQFDFGRPGDESATAAAAGIADGPDSGFATPRRVLLGFVRWDPAITQFVEVAHDHDGVGRRYAGVLADTVAARGGSLALRTRTEVAKGKPGLTLSEEGNGWLAFGPLTAAGAVEPVFSVNAKGDLKIKGEFEGAVTPPSVLVQSGMAMDGVILPLPPGVTQQMVDAGQAVVQVHVSHRAPPSAEPNFSPYWMASPLECSVAADRRVRCTVRWFAPPASVVDLPGACNYLVLASVAGA